MRGRAAHTAFLFTEAPVDAAFLEHPQAGGSRPSLPPDAIPADALPLKYEDHADHLSHGPRLDSSFGDLMTSLQHASGTALGGGFASGANMLFGVSVIGLLIAQGMRSTVRQYIPAKQPELVSSPLLATEEEDASPLLATIKEEEDEDEEAQEDAETAACACAC
ncbi:unnamed protein product [Effrenium voratum]|uniref:Uncharacterized protein n=1 Tax=Effrenium voratum TaxID=2562239 RepID=A0AA36NA15_9DINO|nr:unnamed protein product [Effrenium voratum]CAJ1432266.1 unnamed protein product [Effrenium voratum]